MVYQKTKLGICFGLTFHQNNFASFTQRQHGWNSKRLHDWNSIMNRCEKLQKCMSLYHNDPKFSDILSFRTDRSGQTAQTQIRLLLSGSTLFAISSASFGCISVTKNHLVKLLGWLQQIFGCPKSNCSSDPGLHDCANSVDPEQTAPLIRIYIVCHSSYIF